jgi:hypothetical protein
VKNFLGTEEIDGNEAEGIGWTFRDSKGVEEYPLRSSEIIFIRLGYYLGLREKEWLIKFREPKSKF